mmetsp:Transcript_17279/g.52247  ORF Transcript_17279/g.52247 Transcript_17279/m.52247 type:complete len:86 (+) Transcript_17279:973-1230(+)
MPTFEDEAHQMVAMLLAGAREGPCAAAEVTHTQEMHIHRELMFAEKGTRGEAGMSNRTEASFMPTPAAAPTQGATTDGHPSRTHQ